MSLLDTVTKGRRPRYIWALIYGTDGIGKSTWASHAPNPIFVGAEKGTEQLDVARFAQTESINELFAQLRTLQTEKHDFQTVVLDSLDWIEPLIWKAVCDEGKVENIEQFGGGYGKGYIRALDLWRTLIKELAVLNQSMHVLLIGHAQIKSFQDPELPTAYDRYQLKINDKAAALVREAADAVLFARFETELVRSQGAKAKVRGEGKRIMYTESRPGFDAKNRFNLPFVMPLDWKIFGEAIRAFYGLNGKSDGTTKREHESGKAGPKNDATLEPAAQLKTASVQEQLKTTLNNSPNAPLDKVRRLLEESSISEPEFIEILKAAQIPEAKGSLLDIPDRVLQLALENWDTVAALAEELHKQKTAESWSMTAS
jgi:AAA domain-containing protein